MIAVDRDQAFIEPEGEVTEGYRLPLLEPGHSMFRDIAKNVIKSDPEVATAYYAYSTRLLS